MLEINASTYLFYQFLFVFQHLEESQLTGRKRFIALSKDQIEKVAAKEFESHLENYDDLLLPETDPYYDRYGNIGCGV